MWLEYLIFVLETATIVIAILFIVAGIVSIKAGNNKTNAGSISIECINEKIEKLVSSIQKKILTKKQLKQLDKQCKKNKKRNQDNKIFLLKFTGDIKATAVTQLRQEITAILAVTQKKDEVVVVLESPGGLVHSYGLAASQLQRIRSQGIKLTICVDKVAASGGYMMACVADKIIAAPFAVIGSIGVVAQMPNIHRLLKKNDIDVDVLTAGEYKRTLTVLGENTAKGREKFINKLEDTHSLFKDFIKQNRPELNVDSVADGDVWYGSQAVDNKLIDAIQTSDEYLVEACKRAKIYAVEFKTKKTLLEKFTKDVSSRIENGLTKILSPNQPIL